MILRINTVPNWASVILKSLLALFYKYLGIFWELELTYQQIHSYSQYVVLMRC